MNTFTFFNENFGRFLTQQTNVPHMDAWRALSSTHPLQKGGRNRITSGWAIIRPTGTVMQTRLAVDGIEYDDRTRFQAFAAELAGWDGEPRIFLMFDKAPIPIANIFMTLDLRAVRICSPAGVETFDYTAEPGKDAGVVHRNIARERAGNAA